MSPSKDETGKGEVMFDRTIVVEVSERDSGRRLRWVVFSNQPSGQMSTKRREVEATLAPTERVSEVMSIPNTTDVDNYVDGTAMYGHHAVI